MSDIFFTEVLVPVFDELRTQVVSFVNQKDELLVLADFCDVFFQVF